MRFIYADPGLQDERGHHANHCRYVVAELKARGLCYEVIAYGEIEERLREELGAVRHFRRFTYWITDDDPISGWLNAFHIGARSMCEDMERLDLGPDDVVFVSSVLPAQALGIFQWLARAPKDRLPQIVMEFGTDPGVDVARTSGGSMLVPRDPRSDPRGVLYRFAATQIPADAARWLHMVTIEPHSSLGYEALMGRPVGVLPAPHHALRPSRSRVGKRPIAVAVLGHQRPDKGYQLVRQVAERVLAARTDVRFLIHNAQPNNMPEAQLAIRALAARDPRVVVDERVVEHDMWLDLLDASDLMLCPYRPERYRLSASGIANEAIANAIPIVGPAATGLARLMQEFGRAGTVFERQEPRSIADATLRAVEDFDHIAGLAFEGASQWRRTQGPQAMVEAILNFAAGGAHLPAPPVPGVERGMEVGPG